VTTASSAPSKKALMVQDNFQVYWQNIGTKVSLSETGTPIKIADFAVSLDTDVNPYRSYLLSEIDRGCRVLVFHDTGRVMDASSLEVPRVLAIQADSSTGILPVAVPVDNDPDHMTWQESMDRLRECEKLPAGWDGDGAPCISSDAISVVRQILIDLRHPSTLAAPSLSNVLLPANIVPLRNGGVQLEWYREETYFEIEVDPKGQMSTLFAKPSRDGYDKVRNYRIGRQAATSLVRVFLGMIVVWSSAY